MTNALTIYGEFDTLQRAAMALHKSGYFGDSKSEAQAIVKVMAGAELGLPPFAAMTGIHIIQGKPALGANVIATLIKNDPRYDYRVTKMDDAVCEIAFFENGEHVGISSFTAQDAKRAGTKNMDKFPRNMLFARAISNGARWYTPGIFGGAPVYTPDELGADVDEDGYIVDVTPHPVARQSPQIAETTEAQWGHTTSVSEAPKQTGNGRYIRPMMPDALREVMAKKTAGDDGSAASDKQIKYAVSSLSAIATSNDERHMVTEYLFGVTSSKDLTKKQASAIIDWVEYRDNGSGDWVFNEDAKQEAARVITEQRKASGQAQLFDVGLDTNDKNELAQYGAYMD